MKHGYLLRMLDFLTGAYARRDMWEAKKGNPPKTWIGRLFAVFAWGLEILHDTLDTIREWDNLDKSVGNTLDRYGKNYGVKREGTADNFYRVMIKVKMIAQLSGGDTDTVINAAAALYDVEPQQIRVEELFPAKGRIYINAEEIEEDKKKTAGIIGRLLKRIVACGVGLETIFRLIEIMEATVYVASCSSVVIEDHQKLDYSNRFPAVAGTVCVYSAPYAKVDDMAKLDHKSDPAAGSTLYPLAAVHNQIYHRIGGVENYA